MVPQDEIRQRYQTPTYATELYVLFVYMLYIGIYCKSELRTFWKTDPENLLYYISAQIPFDRFKILIERFCIQDSIYRASNLSFWDKVVELNDYFLEIAQKQRRPGQNIAVDEKIIDESSRSKIIVILPYKPVPKGIKVQVYSNARYFLNQVQHEGGKKGKGLVSINKAKQVSLAVKAPQYYINFQLIGQLIYYISPYRLLSPQPLTSPPRLSILLLY